MDPTALPTDNLYKFMALAGLALAGFCAWLWWKIRELDLAELDRHSEDAARMRAKRDAFKANVKGLREETQKVSDAAITDLLSRQYEQVLQLDAEVDRAAEDFAASRARLDALNARVRRYVPLRKALIFGVIAGGGLSLLGFFRWYSNVQWYTDRQTKADFEDHMAELAEKAKARTAPPHQHTGELIQERLARCPVRNLYGTADAPSGMIARGKCVALDDRPSPTVWCCPAP